MATGRFDALFIDFYGTLVTGDRLAVEQTCQRVVDDFSLEMTAPELAVTWGKAFLSAIESCNGHQFKTLYDCECETLCDTIGDSVGEIDPVPYADMLRAYWMDPPSAPNAVEALRQIDVPICIVSNADTRDIIEAVDRRGFPVDRIITSEDTQSYKPDEEIFRAAMDAMGVEPGRVLHAGDSLHSDVAGAQKLGIATCWVCYEDRILDVGNGRPDHKVSNLKELWSIL